MESVAVIIPTYNRERLLESCVVSAVTQTHPDVTAYVCDDGSTDATAGLMERLCGEFANLRYFPNRLPKGQQGARSCALEMGSEDYVAFLDSDNRYDRQMVARCLERFREKPEVDVVCFGQRCVRTDSADDDCMEWMQEDLPAELHGDILEPLIRMELAIDMGNCLIRRSVLDQCGGIDLSIPSYADFELHLRLARVACYDSLDEVLMDYLIHGDQITADPGKRGAGLAAIMKRDQRVFQEVGGRGAWVDVMYRLLGHAKSARGKARFGLMRDAIAMDPLAVLQAFLKFSSKSEA